jgi:hypothetical protein
VPQRSTLRLVKEIPLRQIARDAIADYKRKQAIGEAREILRCVAVEHGHFLGWWRVESESTALVQCRICGEGAVLRLDTAATRLTDGFGQACPGTFQ